MAKTSKPPAPDLVPLSGLSLESAQSIFSLMGCVLLLYALIDYLDILIPPQFMNPVWEFQSIGKMVGAVWAPLLGLTLVFYHPTDEIHLDKLRVLRLFSWVAFLLGVLYLLLLPLCVVDASRVHKLNLAQVNDQIARQVEQIEQIRTDVETADGEELALLAASNNLNIPNAEDTSNSQLRQELLLKLDQSEQQIRSNADATRKEARFQLIKNTINWSFGLALGGFAFLWIWRLTQWTRFPVV